MLKPSPLNTSVLNRSSSSAVRGPSSGVSRVSDLAKEQAQTRRAKAADSTAAHSQRFGARAMRLTRSRRLRLSPVMVVAQRSRSPGCALTVTRASRVEP